MTDITVAIPTYNRKALLAETIDSVLSQEGASFEVIVVDNASTDGTAAMVSAMGDARVRVEESAVNVGLVGNFNRALVAGTAPFLTVLHDDDLLRPGSLALRAELLASDRTMVVAYGNYGIIDQDRVRTCEVYRPDVPSGAIERPAEYLRAALRGQVRCHMSAALLRRSLIGNVRCDELDGSYTDYGLWMRLACNGSFGLIPLAVADVRVHASAGAAMGNFRLDSSGAVVAFESEQVMRALEVARRVLSNRSLPVPSRTKLRVVAEVDSARRLGRSVATDLAAGMPLWGLMGRVARVQPAAALHPQFWRGVGVRLRDQLRGSPPV